MKTITISLALILAIPACSVSHIEAYEPKRRDYKSPVDLTTAGGESQNGSIYSPNGARAYLFADTRAMRIGDVVTIRVSEQADARRGASTDLSRDSDTSLGLDHGAV